MTLIYPWGFRRTHIFLLALPVLSCRPANKPINELIPLSDGPTSLAGHWQLRYDPELNAPGPGLSLAFVIDSLEDGGFTATLLMAFAGNVGIPPDRFQSTNVRTGPGQAVSWSILFVERDGPQGGITGRRIAQDTILVDELMWGGSEFPAPARTRRLIVRYSSTR